MSVEVSDYAFWMTELEAPGSLPRDTDRVDLCGFWRLQGARTKPDFPVAIWAGDETLVCAIGRKEPFAYGSKDFEEFLGGGWTKCVAVTEDAYHDALNTGVWSADGKRSNNDAVPDDERIVETPADEGGNAAPFHELISERLATLSTSAKALFGKITSREKADAAAVLLASLKKVWEQGEEKRKDEKKPHDDAAKAVQDKWNPILKPATDVRTRLDSDLQEFLRAEQRRLKEEARIEAARVAAENEAIDRKRREVEAENLRREEENARKLDDALASGEKVDDVELEEVQALPERIAAPVVERVLVGDTYGRRTGAKKVKIGVILDYDKVYAAMKDAQFMRDFVEQNVQRIAKSPAGVALDGMKIEEL